MSSIIVFGRDMRASVKIEELARGLGIGMKATSSLSTLTQHLEHDKFDLLLVDASWTEPNPMELIQRSWKRNPVMNAAIFNLYGPAPDVWGATLSGVRIFSQPNALELIRRTLVKISNNFPKPDLEHFGVLLIEDLDAPRYIITSFIESLGYKDVLSARDAKEGLAILRQPNSFIRCVITDINMPEMSGIELTAFLRQDPALRHLPVLALTADPTSANLIECLRAGATGFMVKPPRKQSLTVELEKARRIMYHRLSPRLCGPEEADALEAALSKLGRM